jgi:hypothetical protein
MGDLQMAIDVAKASICRAIFSCKACNSVYPEYNPRAIDLGAQSPLSSRHQDVPVQQTAAGVGCSST